MPAFPFAHALAVQSSIVPRDPIERAPIFATTNAPELSVRAQSRCSSRASLPLTPRLARLLQPLECAHEKKAHANHNVQAGRAFVAAYVEYVHYVEGLHHAAQTASAHHETQDPQSPDHQAHNASVTDHSH